MTIGSWEVLLFIILLILLFGASRLPKLARSVREARREFAKAEQESGGGGLG